MRTRNQKPLVEGLAARGTGNSKPGRPRPRPCFLPVLLAALGLGVGLARPSQAAEAAAAPAAAAKSMALPVADLRRDAPVDFEKEILPFLKNNCFACHNTTKAKGGLNLETPQLILKGGDTGAAAVAGNSTTSLVFKAAAHLDPELIMPPKDNKANASDLKPEQLALLKLWIEQGAKGEVHASRNVDWLEHPPTLDPIFAVALTQDGQFAACSRGNRIDVYHLPSGQLLTRLADPALSATNSALAQAAHRDQINSLAFNPDGTLLASAAFREVKLWRRPVPAQKPAAPGMEPGRLFAVSPNRRWLATATADHRVLIHDLSAGQGVRTFQGHSNTVTALAFSEDSSRLLSASLDRTLRAWDPAHDGSIAVAEAGDELWAALWLGPADRSPATLVAAGPEGRIRSWLLQAATETAGVGAPAFTLAPGRDLGAHQGGILALASLPTQPASLLSGGVDGLIRRWNLQDTNVVREWQQGSPVTALAARPDGKRFASAGTNTATQLWDPEAGKPILSVRGDRYAEERAAATERTLAVTRMDIDYGKKTVETAAAEARKQEERVGIASTTNTFTEKVFLEKEKAFKEAQDSKSKADQELAQLLEGIKKVTEDFEKADKAAQDASAQAKGAMEKASEGRLAAERATLSRSEAEKIAADTTTLAAKTKAAGDNAGAARETAQRIAEESAAVAIKSRAFAEAVTADAEMKTKLAADSKSAAEKAIEQVASLSFAAGRLKPQFDKTLSEAPEKRKAATNRIDTAAKTLGSADAELKKAETRKSITSHELELALAGAARSSNSLAQAKSTLEAAEGRQKQASERLDRQKQEAKAAEQRAIALAFSRDGRTLASLNAVGQTQTWNSDTGAAFEVLPARTPDPAGPPSGTASGSLAFLDAHTLLTLHGPGEIVRCELQPQWTLDRSLGSSDPNSPFADRVNAVRFSPDGTRLATGGGEPTRSGELKLWNLNDGSLHRDLTNVHSDAVLALDFSPDGRHLASSSADRFVRIIELATGKVTRALEGHTSYVLGVAWKADSRTLASAGADNVIKVWDFTTGDRKKNIDGAGKEVTSISFVGITDQAVATSGDNQVRLLKENGEKVRSFEGSTDFMNAVAATPDAKWVVAGGQDGVLRVWDGRDGKVLGSYAATGVPSP